MTKAEAEPTAAEAPTTTWTILLVMARHKPDDHSSAGIERII